MCFKVYIFNNSTRSVDCEFSCTKFTFEKFSKQFIFEGVVSDLFDKSSIVIPLSCLPRVYDVRVVFENEKNISEKELTEN